MKKRWGFVLVAIFVIAAAAVAVAQEPVPSATASDPNRAARRAERRAPRDFFPLHSDGVAMKRDGSTVQFRSQKGIIQAADGDSITLKSADGYEQTYVISDQTKVREKGKPSTAADLKSGEVAKVLSVKESSGYTARLINSVGEPGPRLKELVEKS
jgi:hypothetical protein